MLCKTYYGCKILGWWGWKISGSTNSDGERWDPKWTRSPAKLSINIFNDSHFDIFRHVELMFHENWLRNIWKFLWIKYNLALLIYFNKSQQNSPPPLGLIRNCIVPVDLSPSPLDTQTKLELNRLRDFNFSILKRFQINNPPPHVTSNLQSVTGIIQFRFVLRFH